MEKRSVGVIGGGAAGMTAAITAARQGVQVTLFERNDRVGRKILMTGNGKCNLGNRRLSKAEYYGGDSEFIEERLKQFGTEDTISFFRGLGLMMKEKNGYLYPASEQASVVLDVLRMELKSLGVEIITEYKVNHVEKQARTGEILVSDGSREYLCKQLIIACGGKAAPKTGSDGSGYKLAKQLGHSLVPTVPALVQLRCREEYLKAVAGVRADAEVCIIRAGKCEVRERGELQLTEYGISGIPVFQISRAAGYLLRENREVEVHINLLPDYGEEDLQQLLDCRLVLFGDRTVEEFFTGMLHKKIMQLFVKMAGLKGDMSVEQADKEALRQVFSLCRDWKVTVTGTNPYDNAQVSAGGIPLDEVTKQLESRKVPGVYFAGEVLDVDGKCGGYNLQWAWCSGYLAGMAAAGA